MAPWNSETQRRRGGRIEAKSEQMSLNVVESWKGWSQ